MARKSDMSVTMKITSPAFQAGQAIPPKYTCEGADISPPLQWNGLPDGAKSLALICDDPDAPVGVWVHWVLYDLPVTAKDLPENVPTSETLSFGGKQGINDFKRIGYGGPCPPPGKPHRYYFRLYALKVPKLEIPADATAAYVGFNVLAQAIGRPAELLGMFGA